MNEYKLVDVPEMEYLSTDKDENGNVTPRGEVCLRGPG
jgi:long-chain acyl-CoA synthetase